MSAAERCGCGRPLHYSNQAIRALVQELVAELGPDVTVTTPAGTWLVPRHYLALHGLAAGELPRLAAALGFPAVAAR